MWWFGKMSVFHLSGHLSASLSDDIYIYIYILDSFDFLHLARNMQKSRPISVEKGKVKSELSGFWEIFII